MRRLNPQYIMNLPLPSDTVAIEKGIPNYCEEVSIELSQSCIPNGGSCVDPYTVTIVDRDEEAGVFNL